MKIRFPDNFIFGTSTSAYQIETPFEHDWLNVRSRDGHIFDRTTDHEVKQHEDIDIIASLSPHYRMSLMWSKLQRAPFTRLDKSAVAGYSNMLSKLRERGVEIMMVIHHFANPTWFAESGGWTNKNNARAWLDYGKQLVDNFSPLVSSWNTFNEPNLYTAMAYVTGEFPPYRKNLFKAHRVISNMAEAHNEMYDYIKSTVPDKPVGISHNCTIFHAENIWGVIPSVALDWSYMTYAEELFSKSDFIGMSYYARIGLDPLLVTCLTSPEKIRRYRKDHDDMWEYYPEGLEECILRFWKKYQKPVIVTENGTCTQDDTRRMRAISDYMEALHQAMEKGADVRGYYHWSTWDNFEWSLGPTYRFGLYSCDPLTKERKRKPSADLYARLAFTKEIEIGEHSA